MTKDEIFQPKDETTGGQTFQFRAFSRANWNSYEPNDKPSTATQLNMNTSISANIDTPAADQDYYFFPLKVGQTAAEIKLNFTANVGVTFWLVQKLANGYLWSTPQNIATTDTGKTFTFTGLPGNTAGTTTPYGIMVRVWGANAAAGIEWYSLRAGVGDGYIASMNQINNENISRWYPVRGQLQAANYLTLSATIKDSQNRAIPGETVTFIVRQPGITQTQTAQTDVFGMATTTFNFGSCLSPLAPVTYAAPGLPTDHWQGTAEQGEWMISAASAQPVAPNVGANTSDTIEWWRICQETYLGRW
ncbi:Ig-like domain-containing protein [Silvimonas iriomotensis]|uniref:Ig-like domain-containing protein n=1 Tax=Silvimonas iriomotensis TaxID=449662 RepID=UPI00166D698B|nr:Ig-like domain-containing protein [Silvimonas iriomotensis]